MNTLSLRISASVFDGHLLIALIALEVYVRWREEAKNLSDSQESIQGYRRRSCPKENGEVLHETEACRRGMV